MGRSVVAAKSVNDRFLTGDCSVFLWLAGNVTEIERMTLAMVRETLRHGYRVDAAYVVEGPAEDLMDTVAATPAAGPR
jgi:hypothetical protein